VPKVHGTDGGKPIQRPGSARQMFHTPQLLSFHKTTIWCDSLQVYQKHLALCTMIIISWAKTNNPHN
jgi:hypothetical protein